MTRSSEVVMRLNGLDATDGMFDLVFSRPQGWYSNPLVIQKILWHGHSSWPLLKL